MSATGVKNMADAEELLRAQLALLIENGEAALPDFQVWLTENFWDESSLTKAAADLAHEIDLVLAEYTSGHWTWAQVVDLFENLLARRIAYSASATTERVTVALWGDDIKASAEASTQHVAVSA